MADGDDEHQGPSELQHTREPVGRAGAVSVTIALYPTDTVPADRRRAAAAPRWVHPS